MHTLRRFVREDSGEDLIECGLLAAFVTALAMLVVVADPLGIKKALKGMFQPARAALNSAN